MKYLAAGFVALSVIGAYLLFFAPSTAITNYPLDGTTIVAFGDSLVVGVGSTAGNDLVSMLSDRVGESIINLGVSGDTTRDALQRIDDVTDQDPKVVIVLFGGNDYLQQIPEAETFANLTAVIEAIHNSGSSVILLGVRGGLLRDSFKDNFADLADEYNTAYVPDVLDGLFGNPALMSDAVHPNDAGYEMIADRVQPVLQGLLEE